MQIYWRRQKNDSNTTELVSVPIVDTNEENTTAILGVETSPTTNNLKVEILSIIIGAENNNNLDKLTGQVLSHKSEEWLCLTWENACTGVGDMSLTLINVPVPKLAPVLPNNITFENRNNNNNQRLIKWLISLISQVIWRKRCHHNSLDIILQI